MDMAYDDVRGPMGDTKGPRGPSTFDTFKYKVMELATRLGLSEWLIECKQREMGDDVKIETEHTKHKCRRMRPSRTICPPRGLPCPAGGC